MLKQDQEITLKSIYERVLELKKDTNKLNNKVDQLENEIKENKSWPTISKETKEKNV